MPFAHAGRAQAAIEIIVTGVDGNLALNLLMNSNNIDSLMLTGRNP
jgi:hypothetical protein